MSECRHSNAGGLNLVALRRCRPRMSPSFMVPTPGTWLWYMCRSDPQMVLEVTRTSASSASVSPRTMRGVTTICSAPRHSDASITLEGCRRTSLSG
jgi:hypothetical protein